MLHVLDLKYLSSVLSLSTSVQVLSGRFKVICSSYGGRPLSISITGRSGVAQDVMNIIEVGTAEGIGNDTFSGEIEYYYDGGRDGDNYNCNASNVVSNISQSVALEGILYYEEEVLLMHFTFLLCINSSINSNSTLIKSDILLISESGVESVIRRSHSDWLCSTLQ